MIDDQDKFNAKRRNIELDFDATLDQRDAANEDMRFCNVDGGMWEGWLERTHANRARLELDLVSDYINRFNGEWTQHRAGVTFIEGDDQTDEDEAEFLNGVYRSDFREFSGRLSTDNAVFEMTECGVGAYKLCPKYEDDEDPENLHQDIHFEPIYNAYNHVVWDRNAKRVDKADAKRCTVLTSYTKDAFKDNWPDSQPTSAFDPDNRSHLDWSTPDLVYVAEVYEVRTEKVRVCIYQHLEEGIRHYEKNKDLKKIEDELYADGWEKVREKVIKKQRVYKSLINGSEYLEKEKRIAGKWIPVIPVYGYRKFIDGVEHYRGMVRKLKDANRLINANFSRMAEASSTSGDEIPIFSRSQIKGLEDIWANKVNRSFMVVNDLEDGDGNIQPNPPLGYLKPPAVDPNSAGTIDLASSYIQRTTGNTPQDTVDPDASGKAINALRNRENLNTQTLVDNIVTAKMHEGNVYLEIAREIYTDSRTKALVNEDGSTTIGRLMEAVLDQESGELVEIHDISKGKFKVNVSIGAQYETRREATLESIERIIDKVGDQSQYFNPLLSMWMQNIQGTGLDALKEFNRKQMIIQGLVEPETDEEKAMIEALGQQRNPQEELTLAAAEQQKAEAQNLQASSVQKMADAKKKQAEAVKLTAEIGEGFIERRLKQLESEKPRRLSYNPQTGMLDEAGS